MLTCRAHLQVQKAKSEIISDENVTDCVQHWRTLCCTIQIYLAVLAIGSIPPQLVAGEQVGGIEYCPMASFFWPFRVWHPKLKIDIACAMAVL